MNIFLSVTVNQIEHLIELIFSIIKFTKNKINFYIMLDDIDEKYLNQFKIFNEERISFTFLNTDELDKYLSSKQNLYLTKMAFARVIILKQLSHLDKLLYLDFDTLITNFGLETLYYNCNFKNNQYAAAVEEISIQIYDKKQLNNCKVNHYFNSGFILFNIKKITEDKLIQKILDDLKNCPSYIGYHDQSILNKNFKENVIFINPAFNVQSILMGFKQYDQFAKIWHFKDQIDLINHCIVSHMQSRSKPWEIGHQKWQEWQYPFRKWQDQIYIKNKQELKYYNQLKNH